MDLWAKEDKAIQELQSNVNAYTLKHPDEQELSETDRKFSYYNLLPNEKNGLSPEEVLVYQIEGKIWLASNNDARIFEHLMDYDLLYIERIIMYQKALNRAKC